MRKVPGSMAPDEYTICWSMAQAVLASLCMERIDSHARDHRVLKYGKCAIVCLSGKRMGPGSRARCLKRQQNSVLALLGEPCGP